MKNKLSMFLLFIIKSYTLTAMEEKQPWPYDKLPYEVILTIIEQTDTFISTTNPYAILSKEQRARVQDLPTFIFRFAARMALHKKLGTLFNMKHISSWCSLPPPKTLHQSTFIAALALYEQRSKNILSLYFDMCYLHPFVTLTECDSVPFTTKDRFYNFTSSYRNFFHHFHDAMPKSMCNCKEVLARPLKASITQLK